MIPDEQPKHSDEENRNVVKNEILEVIFHFRKFISEMVAARLPQETSALIEATYYLHQQFSVFSRDLKGRAWSPNPSSPRVPDYIYEEIRAILHNYGNNFDGILQQAQGMQRMIELGKAVKPERISDLQQDLTRTLALSLGYLRSFEVLVTGNMLETISEYIIKVRMYIESLPKRDFSFYSPPVRWKVNSFNEQSLTLRINSFIDLAWIISFMDNLLQNGFRIFKERFKDEEGKEINFELSYWLTDTHFILSVEDNLGGFSQEPMKTAPSAIDNEPIEYVSIQRGASTTGGQGIGLDSLKADVEKHGGIWEMGTVTKDGQRRARISFIVPLVEPPSP